MSLSLSGIIPFSLCWCIHMHIHIHIHTYILSPALLVPLFFLFLAQRFPILYFFFFFFFFFGVFELSAID